MKTEKLKAALDDLLEERKMLDRAISSLEQLISQFEQHTTHVITSKFASSDSEPTYVDLVASILEKHGKPMNIKDLTFEVEKLRGRKVMRSSLEGTIFRHIRSKKDRARIVKVGPAVYALPSWPASTKSLWTEAVASS